MKPYAHNKPLTDAEFECLQEFLERHDTGGGMNVEELDGFFAALITGPDLVMPSEYLPELFGGEIPENCDAKNFEKAMPLVMRHWNTIVDTLSRDEVYLPFLFLDENGISLGNDWAHGYMHGIDMSPQGWARLLEDDQSVGCLIPMFALHHEHDKDTEMRPGPITPEQRENLIEAMAAGILKAYRYLRPDREAMHKKYARERRDKSSRQSSVKIGRNDPCCCGSGKKYKRCCGSVN